MKRVLILLLLNGFLLLKSFTQDLKQFKNLIDITANPEKKSRTSGLFSDQGAWFGFCQQPDSSNIMGFGGPWLISEKKWTSVCLAQVEVMDENQHKILFKKIDQFYLPGCIQSKFISGKLELEQSLVFGEGGIAYIFATVINISNSSQTLSFDWHGNSWQKVKVGERNTIYFELKDDRRLTLFSNKQKCRFIVDTTSNSYKMVNLQPITLNVGEKATTWIAIGLNFNKKELATHYSEMPITLVEAFDQKGKSEKRWEGYLASILLKQKSKYDAIAVKSVMTLVSNWRKAALDLHHDGLIPSHAVTYFDGFWAWDSWKHAAAVFLFAPELAKNQILAMFDYQDSTGMVPVCIYLDKSENNVRDTKPPIAAWSVYETFVNCHDTAFVRAILPKLVSYHSWWYKYRDVNRNGWCEYGSTDGTLEAAAWESGMDNAVRFDSVKMIHASGAAWSMNQESVDLNAFLVAEKNYLSLLYKIVGNSSESKRYEIDYDHLKLKFGDYFFDTKGGYYFDVSIASGQKIRVEGTEAFIPLWAGIASASNAGCVKSMIMNPAKFNTFMPFPTLAADDPKFDPAGYWRGPVWLDQAWFGIAGLAHYRYTDEVKGLTLKLFNNANGLLGNKPIHENYNPLNGDRLKAPHFSWSAAHYLLLYRMGYHLF